ncbi:MAG: PHP domain-containing protein [Candidatus Limiplasma sp.]|nr:PHP domain-containing protein [Candidatus Limiplasma sp.]
MLAYCDLHIHSCLSPCANDDMTPWNIVGMAKVKGLDVIALTDHNAADNLPQAMLAGQAYGVSILPGMELTSREDVHLLAYFPDLAAAMDFGKRVYEHLPAIANDRKLFGNQLIIGDGDATTGQVEKLLFTATDWSADELAALVLAQGGVCVPAHINRGGNGMLSALGWMPPLPQFPVVEVYRAIPCAPDALRGRLVLHSSDAHRLEDIAERDFVLNLEAPTAQAVMAALRKQAVR